LPAIIGGGDSTLTSRTWFFATALVMSLVSTIFIASAVYPRWMKTYTDALT
jgi:hypothetical protein